MVETLMNLKNNKVKKVVAAQSQGGDAMERMKKFLSGLSKTRTGKPNLLLIGVHDCSDALPSSPFA